MRNTIIVTGGSRGIGAATVRLAAQKGFDVCINYHSHAEAAELLAQECRGIGVNALPLQADVSSENEIIRLFKLVDQSLGPIAGLVNNAAILERQTRVENIDASRLSRVLSTNVMGAFICAREAVKRMSRKHGGAGGVIVNVSSIAAKTGSPDEYVDYAASKGAIDAMTIGLAKEVAAEGIRVNAVRPGFIYTDMHASGGEPGRVDRLASGLPMKRGGQPEEVAAAILWLLSHEASYVTGTFVDLAGGR
jgi:NAD(P)-dependent dehydrogenase (short-subunit alcohol dehydrogenase family)